MFVGDFCVDLGAQSSLEVSVHYLLNNADHLILDPAKFPASELSPTPPNCSPLTDLCFPTFHKSFCGDLKPIRPFEVRVYYSCYNVCSSMLQCFRV